MKYKAVIFDFDYTLGDCTEGIAASVNHGLKKLGYEAGELEDIRKTIGLSLKETFSCLTGSRDQEEACLLYTSASGAYIGEKGLRGRGMRRLYRTGERRSHRQLYLHDLVG